MEFCKGRGSRYHSQMQKVNYDSLRFWQHGCPVSDLFCKPHQACGIPLGGLEETAFHFSNLSHLSNVEIRSAHPCFLAAVPCLSRGRFATHPVFFCFLVPRLLQKLPGSLARQSRPDVPSWLVQQRRCFLRWLLYWLWVLFCIGRCVVWPVGIWFSDILCTLDFLHKPMLCVAVM